MASAAPEDRNNLSQKVIPDSLNALYGTYW